MEPVADNRPHVFRFRRNKPDLPSALAGAAEVNGNGPVVEQIAANRDLIEAVVILFKIVGF